MKRILGAVTMFGLALGCVSSGEKTATVSTNPFGIAGPVEPLKKVNFVPAPSEISARVDQVGRNPQWEQAPVRSQWPQGPPPPARPVITSVRTADGQPRKRQLLSIGLFALIAAVLVVPAFLIVHALHGLGGSSAAAAEPTTKPSKSASAPATERSAATALAGLLAQSVTDRDTIVSAVGAVNHCTSAVSQARRPGKAAASLIASVGQGCDRARPPTG